MAYDYSISAWCDGTSYRVKSSEIVAEFERLKIAAPKHLVNVMRNGCRYSYEDHDSLASAMSELYKLDPLVWRRIGRQEHLTPRGWESV